MSKKDDSKADKKDEETKSKRIPLALSVVKNSEKKGKATGPMPPTRKGINPSPLVGFHKVNRSRIVVTEMVYHQPPDDQPVVTQTRFIRWLSSGEQNYVRKTTISARWINLDTGWVKDIGLVVIRNDTQRLTNIPTTEEDEGQNQSIIEVSLGHGSPPSDVPMMIIRPGESMRFEPGEDTTIHLRSRKGEVAVTLNIIPA